MQKNKNHKNEDEWMKPDSKGKQVGYSYTQGSYGEINVPNHFSTNSIQYQNNKNSEKHFENLYFDNHSDFKSKSQPTINDKFNF